MDLRKTITPEDVKKSSPEKFWNKINFGEPDQCWEWTGFIDYGYGRFGRKMNGRWGSMLAHRMMWIYVHGEIPEGQCVLHSCDNRKCCNPAHHFLGTKKENNEDRDRKGRHIALRGSENGQSKLKEIDIPIIRSRIKAGESVCRVAREYGVSHKTLSQAYTGKTWGHVV